MKLRPHLKRDMGRAYLRVVDAWRAQDAPPAADVVDAMWAVLNEPQCGFPGVDGLRCTLPKDHDGPHYDSDWTPQ